MNFRIKATGEKACQIFYCSCMPIFTLKDMVDIIKVLLIRFISFTQDVVNNC